MTKLSRVIKGSCGAMLGLYTALKGSNRAIKGSMRIL